MSERQFHLAIIGVALIFTVLFLVVVAPPLIDNPDVLGAFGAGFGNPYATGYTADVVACWFILGIWVVYEARTKSVKRGWICLLLGVVPGVAVGFAGYLLLRSGQVE